VIAVDSSSWIAFFSDREPSGDDTALVECALADHQACLPPVVVTRLVTRDDDFRHFAHIGGPRLAL